MMSDVQATDPGDAGVRPTGTTPSCAYVTLMLNGQLCGVPVLAVRDVLAGQAVARIPLAPPEVAGNLNLRGRIVTAIDLRARLRLPARPKELTPMSVVTESRAELYALQVDQVSEVVTIEAHSIQQNPQTLPPIWAEHSTGVTRVGKQLMVMLDVERLLKLDEGAVT
jgi:purine-binding chemotaxis protein CheW